jgi:hypothetical protein
VFRGAWTQDRALALLRSDAFDPVVVGALERVLGTGPVGLFVAGLTEPAPATESTHGPAVPRA